jgi:hypothetical protein
VAATIQFFLPIPARRCTGLTRTATKIKGLRRLPIAIAAITALVWFFGVAFVTSAGRPDQPGDDTVGAIEGDAIALQGPMTVEVIHGQIKTVLRSGNDVRVKSGQARIDLVEGGQIVICGPAHLSLLKAGGSLTLALDSGSIRAHIDRQPALTIYTAQIQAKLMAVGDAPQDALIGFDNPGAICVKANSGAVRLEQQLGGQNLIVPQGGDVTIQNGRLEGLQNTPSHCACESQLAKAANNPPEISRLATPEEIQQRDQEVKKAPPAPEEEKDPPPKPKEEPVYQVFMPPLAYDASAKVQKDNFDPKLILLVRRVRVRPTLIFQGRVEGNTVSEAKAPVVPAAAPAKPAPAAAPPSDTVVNRVRAFFHRLLS